MNIEPNSSYLQRIWQKIKTMLSEPRPSRKNGFSVTNEGDCCPSKRPRLEIINKAVHDSFDQSAFLEVMKKLLTCSVCLEVRKQANQCQNGHLICVNCTLCLQQSSTSKDISCPVCRVPLTYFYQRSLLAEQLVCELPTRCRFCSDTMSLKQLEKHESEICLSRIINCQYVLFGCNWRGLAKQKRQHEIICVVGLSSIASASDLVHSNFTKELNYYVQRNSQWNGAITKLRERNRGLKMFMRHLVLSRNRHQPAVKSSFKTSKLEIVDHQFLLKFNITKNKKTQNTAMCYKLKYLNKKKLSMNFFLYSIRYDDEVLELDDNLHCHTFNENENNAGGYNVYFSKNRTDDGVSLADFLSLKDSLYLEIVIILESADLGEQSNLINSQQDGSDSLSQVISTNRTGLAGSNAGNLVVALISSNSLASQPNGENEEESEEQYDQDEEVADQEPEEEAEEDPEEEQGNEEEEEGEENIDEHISEQDENVEDDRLLDDFDEEDKCDKVDDVQ